MNPADCRKGARRCFRPPQQPTSKLMHRRARLRTVMPSFILPNNSPGASAQTKGTAYETGRNLITDVPAGVGKRRMTGEIRHDCASGRMRFFTGRACVGRWPGAGDGFARPRSMGAAVVMRWCCRGALATGWMPVAAWSTRCGCGAAGSAGDARSRWCRGRSCLTAQGVTRVGR